MYRKCIFITRGCGSFDSTPAYSTTSTGLKRQVDAILKTSEKSFDLYHVDVQCQMGGSDCGIFALAFTVSLCMRKDPHTQHSTQSVMREHPCSVSRGEKNVGFSTPWQEKATWKAQNYKQEESWCLLYLPFPWDKFDGKRGPLVQCVTCREWYHQNCLNIGGDVVYQPAAKFTYAWTFDMFN